VLDLTLDDEPVPRSGRIHLMNARHHTRQVLMTHGTQQQSLG
jgi:hypothetical protein